MSKRVEGPFWTLVGHLKTRFDSLLSLFKFRKMCRTLFRHPCPRSKHVFYTKDVLYQPPGWWILEMPVNMSRNFGIQTSILPLMHLTSRSATSFRTLMDLKLRSLPDGVVKEKTKRQSTLYFQRPSKMPMNMFKQDMHGWSMEQVQRVLSGLAP